MFRVYESMYPNSIYFGPNHLYGHCFQANVYTTWGHGSSGAVYQTSGLVEKTETLDVGP